MWTISRSGGSAIWTDMVKKDYNHPCVMLYSTGNEVSETAQKRASL